MHIQNNILKSYLLTPLFANTYFVKEDTVDYALGAEKPKRLNPLNDYLFKQYMGTQECKICIISFLSAVLGEIITDVEIIDNLELPKEGLKGKFGRLDVRAKLLDGTQINIELQLLNENNIVERSQYYNGRLFISGIKSGDDYASLGRVIAINILNFNYFPYPDFHISSHFRVDQYPGDILSPKQELHFLELKKFYSSKAYDKTKSLHRWLKFFDRNLSEEELKELIEMDQAIKTAAQKTEQVALSEREMLYYESLEDARRDRISAERYHREQGFKLGMEEGIAEGVSEGEAKMANLLKHLLQDNRMAELQEITHNFALKEQLYKEYGL